VERRRTIQLALGVGVALLLGYLAGRLGGGGAAPDLAGSPPATAEPPPRLGGRPAPAGGDRPDIRPLPEPRPELLASLPEPVAPPESDDSEVYEDWREGRIIAISKQAWYDETPAMKTILAELASPDPLIREAALDSVLAQGRREAIPYLEAFAASSEQADEIGEMLDGVEHLKLPSVREVMQARKEAAAR